MMMLPGGRGLRNIARQVRDYSQLRVMNSRKCAQLSSGTIVAETTLRRKGCEPDEAYENRMHPLSYGSDSRF